MPVPKILIVEQDSDAVSALESSITDLGYPVELVRASDAREIRTVDDGATQLAVMRVAPNDAGVLRAAQDLRARWGIPVLLIASDGVDALGPGLTARNIPRLAEPFTPRELRCAIELALSTYDAVRSIHALEDRFFWTSIDMLCFLDFSGYFKRLNPSWERTLGFTCEELMSRPFIEFVHPDDRERTLAQNARVRAGGQALAFENRYLCKDGSFRWFKWNAAPDSAEQVIYSVARDVTEHKQAEEERERLVLELQEALAEVRTLQEILPICSYCKNIRDDANYWHSVEGYISQHTNAQFSHSICPDCYASEVLPQFDALDER
jgi:PAS domain S-box-containing protein